MLYDNPSMVVARAQPLSDCPKGYTAMTQFAKHPVLYRREIIPACCASLLRNLRLAIFEMHMQNTFAETLESVLDDLAINAAGAIEKVTGIKHQP